MKNQMKKLRSGLRRRQIKRIFAVLLCLCMLVPMLQLTATEVSAADYGSTAYKYAPGPGEGGTFVFFANISNNLEKSDPADRLLTADTIIPSNTKGTTTTEFSKDENYSTNGIIWGNDTNLADYRFIITKIGDTIQGPYTIMQEKSGKYLDVTQSYQITKQKGSTVQYMRYGNPTYFDGEVFPTLAYVCLSDNHRTWYWDETTGSFFTYYSSDVAGSGSRVTAAGGISEVFAEVTASEVNLVNWGNFRAYANNSDVIGYQSFDNFKGHFSANYKLPLVAVNSGNEKHPDYFNNMAEVLHNPLYYLHDMFPSVGSGCASLSVLNGNWDIYYGTYASAEQKPLKLYREVPLCRLTVNNGSGGGIYPEGTTVRISAANPTADGHFNKWEIVSGEGDIGVEQWPSTSITLSSDVEIEAVYSPHTMQPDDGDCLTEEKCTICGYVAIPKQEAHNLGKYTNPSDGKHTAHCVNTGCTYTETQDCTSDDTATCKTRKVCDVCGASFGELDPDNHEGTASWQQTKTTHKKAYDCCGAVVVPEEEHAWENGECTVCGYSCSHEGGEESYFQKPVCDICGDEYGELLIDSTVPTGEIKVSDNIWKTLLNKITFGKFFKETQQVEITASDDSYEHTGYTDKYKAKVEYYLHNGDTALTKDELDEITFTPYEGSFNIAQDNQYVIYAKITDHAGNITYISSDGIVFDTVKPVIKGITDGKTYCEAQVFTIEETNLDSVLINGAVATADNTGNYVLTAENKEYTITVTDKAGNSTLCTVTVNNGHDWNDTTYAWSDDGTSCTATRTCKNDPSHTETATGTITSKQTKAPTCTEKGETTYTATFEADWAMTQTRVLADIPATDHSYGKPVWSWSEDGKTCTATFTCQNDSSHVEQPEVDVTSEVTVPATCTDDGTTTYTAIVEFNGQTYTDTKDVADIPATGHSYGKPVWNWSEDGKTCTATFTCEKDETHKESPEVTVTSEVKTPATCTEKGVTTYTATVEFNGQTYTDTKDVADIPAIGHSYEDGKCTVCGAADPNYKPTESGNENPDSSETDNNTQSPQTGDNSNMMLWIALLFVSGAGLFGTTAYNRKKKYIK